MKKRGQATIAALVVIGAGLSFAPSAFSQDQDYARNGGYAGADYLLGTGDVDNLDYVSFGAGFQYRF